MKVISRNNINDAFDSIFWEDAEVGGLYVDSVGAYYLCTDSENFVCLTVGNSRGDVGECFASLDNAREVAYGDVYLSIP